MDITYKTVQRVRGYNAWSQSRRGRGIRIWDVDVEKFQERENILEEGRSNKL